VSGSPADIDTSDEPSVVPAAPSRPADETVLGMTRDTWAIMVERKIDAFDLAHRQRAEAQDANFVAFKGEALDVLKRVVEVLERMEHHEWLFRDQRTDINTNTRQIGVHDDQLAALKLKVAALEQGHADHAATIVKLNEAAAKRAKRK
jgi:pterin-4a-carbinolamine dehydratase